MDSIIADFYYGILRAYEEKTGQKAPPDQLGEWDAKLPDGSSCIEYFSKPGFFRGLRPIYGGLSFIREARAYGHEVVIVTSATLTNAPGEKFEWLSYHLPEFPRRDVIMATRKGLIQGDALIDDHAHNAKAFTEAQPEALVVGIEYPYNKGDREHFDFLAPSYLDLEGAWAQLSRYLLVGDRERSCR